MPNESANNAVLAFLRTFAGPVTLAEFMRISGFTSEIGILGAVNVLVERGLAVRTLQTYQPDYRDSVLLSAVI